MSEAPAGHAFSPTHLAIVWLLRFHHVAIEPEQLLHETGGAPSMLTLLRFLRGSGLKAKAVRIRPERLARTPMPAIAMMSNGNGVVVGGVAEDSVLFVDTATLLPATRPLPAFLSDWSGILILATRRDGVSPLGQRFNLGWFAGAVRKYRRVLAEVLVASLFLQIFALATPFAFQILVDKVLVNRGMSTLDVLAFGLGAIALFEAVLGGLRTFVFTHTTNRIDVELGAKLFRHLLSLPLAYFQARRIGDSVARVRELETIRQFLTGSALTLVIDLLFTGIFLAVMANYSLMLTAIVLASLPIYIAVSAIATPIFRSRLDARFKRGAENQAFLVESISGIETLKAMAVEPQMQQRWEEQLAGYVGASNAVSTIGNVATQSIQVTSKLATAATLWFGAHEVIAGSLTVGGLVAFNMLASRCCVWRRCTRTSIRPASRSSVSATF